MRSRLLSFIIVMLLVLGWSGTARAASYSIYIGEGYAGYGRYSYSTAAINVAGFNISQGFSQQIPAHVSSTYSSGNGGRYRFYLNYTLPDDGSTWKIAGGVSIAQVSSPIEPSDPTSILGYIFYKIDAANTTPGNYTGVSIGQAVSAANAAKSAADAAGLNSLNAYNSVKDANGNTITAVRDAGGTVLQASREANTKLDTLHSIINNMNTSLSSISYDVGADTTPPVVGIRTLSGAMATSGDYIRAILDISDNRDGSFAYSLDGSAYSAVPHDRIINIPVNNPGLNVINIRIKDEAGNVGGTAITIRKLHYQR